MSTNNSLENPIPKVRKQTSNILIKLVLDDNVEFNAFYYKNSVSKEINNGLLELTVHQKKDDLNHYIIYVKTSVVKNIFVDSNYNIYSPRYLGYDQNNNYYQASLMNDDHALYVLKTYKDLHIYDQIYTFMENSPVDSLNMTDHLYRYIQLPNYKDKLNYINQHGLYSQTSFLDTNCDAYLKLCEKASNEKVVQTEASDLNADTSKPDVYKDSAFKNTPTLDSNEIKDLNGHNLSKSFEQPLDPLRKSIMDIINENSNPDKIFMETILVRRDQKQSKKLFADVYEDSLSVSKKQGKSISYNDYAKFFLTHYKIIPNNLRQNRANKWLQNVYDDLPLQIQSEYKKYTKSNN